MDRSQKLAIFAYNHSYSLSYLLFSLSPPFPHRREQKKGSNKNERREEAMVDQQSEGQFLSSFYGCFFRVSLIVFGFADGGEVHPGSTGDDGNARST